MGTYFYDATLDKTYSDLISATTALCGNIAGTGLRHIHNALLSKAGLTRNTSPSTPGDYLKGIAVCARKINGRNDYLTATSTLAEILHCVKNPASLDVGTISYSFYFEPSEQSSLLYLSLVLDDFHGDVTNVKYFLLNSEGDIVEQQTSDSVYTYFPKNVESLSFGNYYVQINVYYTFNGTSGIYSLETHEEEYIPKEPTSDSESTVTRYGITVTFKNNGDLTVSSDGLEIDYCNTYFYDEYGNEIHSDQQFEYRNYATELSAQGYVRAQVEVVTMSGDMLSIETGFINFP